ncbi:MAG: (d)CMP kinase [Gammaproteobacteria bacterium]|jgi:cytidylate kinase
MSNDDKAPVLTIDGPSGSGKGTVSQAVARKLGWNFLDSGALYRLVALASQTAGIDESDAPALAALARTLDVRFEAAGPGREERVLLAGREVSREIRTEECGNAASRVAALPEVREALVDLQHSFREPPGLVADGRDMGTAIFPDAAVKIFLTASAMERAKRRHKQLNEKGLGASLDALYREISERDARDASRAISPLRPAADARVIDTTGVPVEEVISKVLAAVAERTAGGPG